MHDFDVVHIDANLTGDQLREGCFLSLTMRRRADKRLDLSCRMDADDCAFPKTPLKSNRTGHL